MDDHYFGYLSLGPDRMDCIAFEKPSASLAWPRIGLDKRDLILFSCEFASYLQPW